MSYEMKEGDFVLFPNEKRSDKDPDMTGKVMENGKIRRMVAWTKTGKGKFLSGRISDFQINYDNMTKAEPDDSNHLTNEDDLPF